MHTTRLTTRHVYLCAAKQHNATQQEQIIFYYYSSIVYSWTQTLQTIHILCLPAAPTSPFPAGDTNS